MSEEKNDLTKDEVGKTTAVSKERKQLKVLGPDNFGMWYLGFENGGELPHKIRGSRWTSQVDAQRAADAINRSR